MSISLAIPAHAGNRIPKREAPSQTTLNQSTQEILYYVIPFAHPVPENGREIDDLDDKSDLEHRIMLVKLSFHYH